jgi:hypothetical protein
MKDIYEKLDVILEKFPQIRQENKFYPSKYDLEQKLSEEELIRVKNDFGDLTKPSNLEDNWNAVKLKADVLVSLNLKKMLEDEFGLTRKFSGFFWYPPDAFCGWHTNNNCEGERIYLAWAAEENKSFFRYQDVDTGEIVTDWDKKGWQFRKFTVSREKPLWHCVGSKTNRISIGFRVV